jgi:hypothetical protein
LSKCLCAAERNDAEATAAAAAIAVAVAAFLARPAWYLDSSAIWKALDGGMSEMTCMAASGQSSSHVQGLM